MFVTVTLRVISLQYNTVSVYTSMRAECTMYTYDSLNPIICILQLKRCVNGDIVIELELILFPAIFP